jgi:group I intron endonuclease
MKEEKHMGIYMIQSISKPERVYVGSAAFDIIDRWKLHLRELKGSKHHSIKLQRHFNKYGLEDLAFEVIESGEYINSMHILSREQGWFDHFRYKDTDLPYFNTTPIAGSMQGYKFTKEQIKAMSDRMVEHIPWNKGFKYPPGNRERFGKYNIGNKYRLGDTASKETREKQRIAKLGKPAWNKDKIVDEIWGVKKPILQYDLDMNFVREWNSAFDAARGLSIIPNHIYSVMKGKRKTACGFIWRYK